MFPVLGAGEALLRGGMPYRDGWSIVMESTANVINLSDVDTLEQIALPIYLLHDVSCLHGIYQLKKGKSSKIPINKPVFLNHVQAT